MISQFEYINESAEIEVVSPEELDAMLAQAWRHFGTHFFRYNIGICQEELRLVLPLRIRIQDFSPSRSQRKVLNKNADLIVQIAPVAITPRIEEVFEKHKTRFTEGSPGTIYDFLSFDAANVPCTAKMVQVFNEEDLIAVSFFDVGNSAISSIYAVFDPEFSGRSLGNFTLLKEIDFARENGFEFCYHGYAYTGNSFYDYKKRFAATEFFDWHGGWHALHSTEARTK